MHHIRRIPDAELPTEALTAQELLDHGLLRIGTDPGTGDGIYSVPCVDPCPGHAGVELAAGFLNERHQALDSAVKAQVLRAQVWRAKDGRVNLRTNVEQQLAETIDAREPLRRAGEREPDEKAQRVLGHLRQRQDVDRRLVPADDIADSDVVERSELYPMRWAGEISTR